MCGYIRYYMAAGNAKRGIRATEWSIGYLRQAKDDPDKRSFLDKIISIHYLLQAVIRDSDGQTGNAQKDLRKAVQMARIYDESSVYTMENVAFTEHAPETVYFYDDAGPTAVDSLRSTLSEAVDLVSASFRSRFEQALS